MIMDGTLKFSTVVAGSVHVQNNTFFENSISFERGVFLLYNNNVCITSNFKLLAFSDLSIFPNVTVWKK